MEKYLLAIAAIGFVFGCMSIASEHSLITWLSTLGNVLLMIFWATQIKKKSYSWMCAYETENGSGRVFIIADAKKLSESLVLGIEEYLRNKNKTSHCHVVNLQFIGEVE